MKYFAKCKTIKGFFRCHDQYEIIIVLYCSWQLHEEKKLICSCENHKIEHQFLTFGVQSRAVRTGHMLTRFLFTIAATLSFYRGRRLSTHHV